jgi:hypothetical protein
VEHFHDHKPSFFRLIDKQLFHSSTHSACQSDLFNFFLFHRKTSFLYLSTQALITMKFTANTDGVWKDFIYGTDYCCFKIVLYVCWWPKITPILLQS